MNTTTGVCYFAERNGTSAEYSGKMLKRGMIVSTTVIDLMADLWKALGGYSPLLPLANCSFHFMNMILKVSLLHYIPLGTCKEGRGLLEQQGVMDHYLHCELNDLNACNDQLSPDIK